jgi:hypothetical protein
VSRLNSHSISFYSRSTIMRTALVSCSHSYMIPVPTRMVAAQGGHFGDSPPLSATTLTLPRCGLSFAQPSVETVCFVSFESNLAAYRGFLECRCFMFIIFLQISAALCLDVILCFLAPVYSRALHPHHYTSQPPSTVCFALLYFFQQRSDH